MGATSGDVRRLVVGEAARLAATGIVVGAAGAVVLSRTLSRFMFQISTLDATTFVVASLLLAAAVLLATFIPAQRAARADPMRALRSE